jgi:hypothetical protein
LIKIFKITVILLLFYFPIAVVAWSHVGHKVVAHIAYDHLCSEAKQAVDRLTEEEGKHYSGRSRFVYCSTWADWSRDRGDTRFRLWHYIDLPLSVDGRPAPMPKAINAVYGLNHCQVVLKNPRANRDEQKTCLKLLVHIVGDLHQPLHTVNRYSQRHPRGDQGGNSYQIKSAVANNLHALWDRGLGSFKPFQQRRPHTGKMIQLFAQGIQQRYPLKNYGQGKIAEPRVLPTSYSQSIHDKLSDPPIIWAKEGREIAQSLVYQVPEYSRPSEAYLKEGRAVIEERLVLAGYRLAALLNTIYTHTDGNLH